MSRIEKAELFKELINPDEEPLSAFFTTFAFEPDYFDFILLPSILKVKMDGEISSGAQFFALMQRLKQIPVGVVADAKINSLRAPKIYGYLYETTYDSLQHSKIFLIEYEASIRLVIGSANLTKSAFHSNQETYISLVINEGSEHWHILDSAIKYLYSLSGEQNELIKILNQINLKSEKLKPEDSDSLDLDVNFYGISPVSQNNTIIQSLSDILDRKGIKKRERTINRIDVISPYFEGDSEDPKASEMYKLLDEANSHNKQALRSKHITVEVNIYAPSTVDGMLETKFPAKTFQKLEKESPHVFDILGNPTVIKEGKNDITRFPHGKGYLIQGESYTFVVAGSSNFSPTGLGKVGPRSNWEANITVFYDKVKTSVRKHIIPETVELQGLVNPKDPLSDLNPDEVKGDLVIESAVFQDGKLSLKPRANKNLNDYRFKIGKDGIPVEETKSGFIAPIVKLSHHVLGVCSQNELVQLVAITVLDDSYQPMKVNVPRDELIGWIEDRYLTTTDLPFPGAYDEDEFGPTSGISSKDKTLGEIDTENYLVYRAKKFNKFLSHVFSKVHSIKEYPKRLDYHLGEEFGLINCVREYVKSFQDGKEPSLMLFQLGELVNTVYTATQNQENTDSRGVRNKFIQNAHEAIQNLKNSNPKDDQLQIYLGKVIERISSCERKIAS